jgi:hypothetical protein
MTEPTHARTRGHLQLAPSASVLPLLSPTQATTTTEEPGMEPEQRLQQLENAIRELDVTANLALRLQLITFEALADASPGTLAAVHHAIGATANALATVPDPATPTDERLLAGLRDIRATIGQML